MLFLGVWVLFVVGALLPADTVKIPAGDWSEFARAVDSRYSIRQHLWLRRATENAPPIPLQIEDGWIRAHWLWGCQCEFLFSSPDVLAECSNPEWGMKLEDELGRKVRVERTFLSQQLLFRAGANHLVVVSEPEDMLLQIKDARTDRVLVRYLMNCRTGFGICKIDDIPPP